ncbi:MAG: TonB family protein [Candidatus Acidiferrales bacterium]
MAPLTKDTLEVTNSAADTNKLKSGTAAKAEQPAGHLRADAVSLEVPVKVHGSRVIEVVRDVTPHTEPFEEQTSTMIVFPQGAVIRMSTTVSVGQMLVVTNQKSRQDAICRVVKVRTFSNLQGYVEVEFTHKQPGYWNVYFPSEGSAAPANKPAQPTVIDTPTPVKKAPVAAAPEISWAPAPAPEPLVQKPVEPESFSPAVTPPAIPSPMNATAKITAPFISIGSQEEVQPAATTITAKPPAPVIPRFETVTKPAQVKSSPSSVVEFPPATPVQVPPAIPSTGLPADTIAASVASESTAEVPAVAAFSSSAPARSTFGSLSGGASLNVSQEESAVVSASVLSSSDTASVEHKAGNNWILVAACIAVLFAAGVGGMIYFRGQSSNRSANATNPPVVAPPVNAAAANTVQPAAASPASSSSKNSGHEPAASIRPSIVVSANAPAETHDAPVSENRSTTSTKQSEPRVTNDMMSETLNSHPVSSQRTAGAQTDAAPAVDTMAPPPVPENGALTGIGSSAMAAPPAPELRPDGPVKIGGQVKEPRLLSSTLPVYPALAKQSNIQGDVVIRATIDKAGRVAHMDVVSGPAVLRQAALDALSRWKYEPSKLDGQPVSVQMLVTIKFRR